VWRWDQQEPFGATAPNDDPDGDGVKVDFPLRFPGQYADRETDLAYNMARNYSSEIGRYVESDPIGLQSGLNPYLYGKSAPLTSIDPKGLLVWSGTYHSRGYAAPVGAYLMQFDLVSPCINNQRAKIHVVAVGPAAGAGFAIDASETYGKLDFEDHLDYVAPTSFNGLFLSASAGVTIGKNISYNIGKIRLGRAYQIDPFAESEGLDVGVNLVIGLSTVTKVDLECCK